MKKLIHTVLLVIALAMVGEEASAIQIRGSRSCGAWVKERAEINAASEAWLVGYLSGIAMALEVEFFGGGNTRYNHLDNNSIFLWMDNYCKANPLKMLSDGADALFVEVTKGR